VQDAVKVGPVRRAVVGPRANRRVVRLDEEVGLVVALALERKLEHAVAVCEVSRAPVERAHAHIELVWYPVARSNMDRMYELPERGKVASAVRAILPLYGVVWTMSGQLGSTAECSCLLHCAQGKIENRRNRLSAALRMRKPSKDGAIQASRRT